MRWFERSSREKKLITEWIWLFLTYFVCFSVVINSLLCLLENSTVGKDDVCLQMSVLFSSSCLRANILYFIRTFHLCNTLNATDTDLNRFDFQRQCRSTIEIIVLCDRNVLLFNYLYVSTMLQQYQGHTEHELIFWRS